MAIYSLLLLLPKCSSPLKKVWSTALSFSGISNQPHIKAYTSPTQKEEEAECGSQYIFYKTTSTLQRLCKCFRTLCWLLLPWMPCFSGGAFSFEGLLLPQSRFSLPSWSPRSKASLSFASWLSCSPGLLLLYILWLPMLPCIPLLLAQLPLAVLMSASLWLPLTTRLWSFLVFHCGFGPRMLLTLISHWMHVFAFFLGRGGLAEPSFSPRALWEQV